MFLSLQWIGWKKYLFLFQWNIELEEMEKVFLEQAAEVNLADRELMENGEKVRW